MKPTLTQHRDAHSHDAFGQTDHRPWPLPPGRWSWRQSWRDLLFAHWPVAAAAIRPLVPAELTVQEFDGTSWIAVVPFRMAGVMRRPLPDLPWVSAFPELNVRVYVEAGGKPGVFFFSLDATNPLTPSFQLAIGHGTSGGEQVQAWAPSASVVKIFNTTGLENMANPVYPQGRAAMVYAGGDAHAKQTAAALAADLGFEPLDLGGLDGARYLEPAAMVWIKLAIVQKLGRGIAFGLMRR